MGRLWGGSGKALRGLWEGSGKALGRALGALAVLEAPGVSGMVYLHKQPPLHNRIEKFPFLLLSLNVFEGTTQQVPYMVTFGDPRLGHRVGGPIKGPLNQHRQDPTS